MGEAQQPLFTELYALKTAGLSWPALCDFLVGDSLHEDLSFHPLFLRMSLLERQNIYPPFFFLIGCAFLTSAFITLGYSLLPTHVTPFKDGIVR